MFDATDSKPTSSSLVLELENKRLKKVNEILNRFNTRSYECVDKAGKKHPAYKCTGIMIRGINNEQNLKHSWSMKKSNKEKESFSLGYLRRDQTFSRFPRDYDSGFIVYPHFETPSSKNTYEVLCSFPVDAHTDNRNNHGCGLSIGDDTEQSKPCHEQNINSLKKWKRHFDEIISSNNAKFVTRQCGFDLTRENSAEYFLISLKANEDYLKTNNKYSSRNNELRMHSWNENRAEKIPIEAFFYLSGSENGRINAKKYQTDFYKNGNTFVPIVGIELPQSSNDDFHVQ